jgi:hypothetical protein
MYRYMLSKSTQTKVLLNYMIDMITYSNILRARTRTLTDYTRIGTQAGAQTTNPSL